LILYFFKKSRISEKTAPLPDPGASVESSTVNIRRFLLPPFLRQADQRLLQLRLLVPGRHRSQSVILLLDFGQEPSWTVVADRLVATLAGCALALTLGYLAWSTVSASASCAGRPVNR
jgi:hypothetical protein